MTSMCYLDRALPVRFLTGKGNIDNFRSDGCYAKNRLATSMPVIHYNLLSPARIARLKDVSFLAWSQADRRSRHHLLADTHGSWDRHSGVLSSIRRRLPSLRSCARVGGTERTKTGDVHSVHGTQCKFLCWLYPCLLIPCQGRL